MSNDLLNFVWRAIELTPKIVSRGDDKPEIVRPNALTTRMPIADYLERGLTVAGTDLMDRQIKENPILSMLLGGWSERLGVTVQTIDGLFDGSKIASVDAPVTSYWVSENASLSTESVPAFTTKSISPKTIGARCALSRRSGLSAVDTEELLIREINRSIRGEVEKVMLIGQSANDEPVGVTNATGIGTQDATGGALSAILAAIEDLHDAGTSANGIVAKQTVKTTLLNTAWQGGTIWKYDVASPTGETCLGLPAAVSKDLSAGELVVGDWSRLRVIFGSEIEFLAARGVGPIVGLKGGTDVTAFLEADVLVERPSAFTLVSNIS